MIAMAGRLLMLLLVALLPLVLVSAADPDDLCVYTIYIRTGGGIKAGTDSHISVTLGSPSGGQISIPDIEAWGLMEPGHDYFERGNLDVFTGRGLCLGSLSSPLCLGSLSSPLCRLNLTSDGAGKHHGWYCEYVEVTATGPHAGCSQTLFYVRQWLASDAPPYQLTAVVDGCGAGEEVGNGKKRLVVGGGGGGAVAAE